MQIARMEYSFSYCLVEFLERFCWMQTAIRYPWVFYWLCRWIVKPA